jgi:ABC-type sugar transport system substrate-binding protein
MAAVSGAAIVALALAACGASGGSSSGTTSAAGTSTGTLTPGTTLAELKAAVTTASAVPAFTPPGPAISDPAALKGDKMMAIPDSSHLASCEQNAQVFASIGSDMGTPVTVFQNDGEPSQWEQGIETAIDEKYKAIALFCGINPDSIAPQLRQAIAAGIKVVEYGALAASPLLTAETIAPYAQDDTALVDAALAETGGKPTNALIITANSVIEMPIMVAAIKAEFAKRCGSACKLTFVDIEVPDWATKVQSTVTSELIANPDITTLIPTFSGMLAYAVPGVQAARAKNVHIFTFGQGNTENKQQETPPGSTMILGDINGSAQWTGYEAYYQTALVLSGQPPVPLEQAYAPGRMFTPQNVSEYFNNAGGFGTSFINGFRQLFGLPSLSGAALAAAAAQGNDAA